jgi:hypothetical protein
MVKWGSYEIDAAKEEQEALDQSGGSSFFKLKPGRNVVRFLPPKVGQRTPFVMVHQHYVQLPGQTNPASFNCPRVMAKRSCAICARVDELRATGNPADYDMAGQLFPKLRIFANIIDRSNPEQGPQVLAFGKQIHDALVKLRTDEDAGGDYTHPQEGFDIIITRTGTGKNDTKYTVNPARASSDLGDYEWIAIQPDLRRFANVPSDADIQAAIAGAFGSADGGAPAQHAAGRAVARGQGRPRSSARSVQDTIDVDPDEVK